MKKCINVFLLILSVFSATCFTACGSEDEDPLTPGETTSVSPSASFSEPSLAFGWEKSTKQITVTIKGISNLYYFQMRSEDSAIGFCEGDMKDGPGTFSISFTCNENETFEERSLRFTLYILGPHQYEEAIAYYTIKQEGRPNIIPIRKGYLIDNAGGTLDIGFISNSDYTCTIEDDAKSWIHETNASTRGYSEKARRFTIDACNISRREGHITFKADYVEESITVVQTSNIANGYEFVDLGLPSGTKWATCNIGANAYFEYGDFYAWGETEPKVEYTEENYKYSKYNNGNDADGFHVKDPFYEYENIGKDISGTQYDVAHVKWGGNWSMPTFDQVVELLKYTKKQYATINGVSGYKITSVVTGNNNWIFMPKAGFASNEHNDQNGNHVGASFEYWTSTAWWPGGSDEEAYHFYSVDKEPDEKFGQRWRGFSIRPIIK